METIESLRQEFTDRYGAEPELICFAPGRVNLIGEHTDYNGGHVFPCALSMGTWCAARRRSDRRVRLSSVNVPRAGVAEHPLGFRAPEGSRSWTRYPEGVISAFAEFGHAVPRGMDLLFYGNVPSGSGLSSSASMEVVTGTVLRELWCPEVSLPEIARLGQYAENVFVGVSCGIMDQFASAMGKADHAIFLDTATLAYEYAPLRLPDAEIVICNSKVKHSLASSAYNDRRRECERAVAALNAVRPLKALGELSPAEFDSLAEHISDPVCRRRAKHAVYENERTRLALAALRQDRINEFGRLMNESHVSLRDDYEVSCPELDLLAELAWATEGVIGSRMTGGGFGGCTVSIVQKDAVQRFTERVGAEYQKQTGLQPEFYVAAPGDGARRVE